MLIKLLTQSKLSKQKLIDKLTSMQMNEAAALVQQQEENHSSLEIAEANSSKLVSVNSSIANE